MSALKPLTAQAFCAAGDRTRDGLAALPEAFSRFARELGRNMSKFSASPASFAYESFGLQSKDAAAGTDDAAFILCGADPECMARVVMDRALVFGFCDLLLGGVGNEQPFAEERPFSRLELALAELVAVEAGVALPQAFPDAALEPLSLQTAAEDTPAFEAALSITMLGTIHGYCGEMRLELSAALASLLKPGTAAHEKTAKPSMDAISVDLTAILAEVPMSLDDIGRLGRGQLIRLGATAVTPVSVTSGGVELFKARLGQGERKFCLGII